ncbi:MotA/TolQ/ExbB proton channel family protein [Nitratireductor basaltis]|uniref:Outer membrane transport energization protein ExbB n=1 Tax=Nitratireductor basaltis TaxID=472175 RepID=A0A084UA32_9HYPH|nr:MotA/TolQ/ExbB proton channel family protein [Nitratireductor basaltis]KFB09818.1 Outer membrane transport energization protein ExbB precursor [Nitratireductor basaltis]
MPAELLQTISSFMALGGPVVALLVVLSVFAFAIILLKLAQFWRERVGRHGRARRALAQWQTGEHASARTLIADDRAPASAAIATAMKLRASGQTERNLIEAEVARVAGARLHDLQRGFRALDAISQVAPLLGLFGTVLGMIEAFRKLQEAGNAVDPSLLAGGIWVALLTTATGLAIAMPVSLILAWFETRLENERVEIETLTGALLNGTDAHGSPTRNDVAAAGATSHAH